MAITLKKISISLILLASMAAAYAEPGRDRDARDHGRQERMEQGGQGGRSGFQQRGDPRDGQAVRPDGLRRPSRLSPEERRTLRRQIDEAGHDVYAPRR
jgi:hypothetical protein